MTNKIILGRYETTTITITVITTQLFLNYPRLMMESVWTAGWILSIYTAILALVAFTVISKLYSPFEGKDLIDIGEYIGGGVGRIIVGIPIISLFLFAIPLILREFSENMKIIALQNTPISLVTIFFLIGVIVGAYIGIEAIVRFSSIAVPIITIGFFVIIIGASQYIDDLSRITPILGNGAFNIFVNGIPKISTFSGIITLMLLHPYIKSHKHFKVIGYSSIIVSAIFFVSGVLVFSLVYQYPTGTEAFLPIYQLSRLVDYGRFFQRIESVFVLMWGAAALLYMSILMFLTVHIIKKTFKLSFHKPLIMPFAIIVFTLSLMPHNLISSIELETKYFRNFAWTVSFLLPIVVLVIARIVKSKSKEKKV